VTVSVSPNGKNSYATGAADNTALVATLDGIVELARSGGAWRESRRMLAGKHVGSIMVEPTSGAIFAGAHKGGLWASVDGGTSWQARGEGIELDDIYALNCVAADGEVRLYAGTEPAHLYVSTNLGMRWTELPSLRDAPSLDSWTFPAPPHVGHVKTIAFDPRDANTIYVGVEVGGAFKTTDGGKTWRELNDAGFYVDVHRLMVSPARPDHVYMATGRGLYHSTDAGESWSRLSLPGTIEGNEHERQNGISYPDGLVILPQQPEVLFTSGASSSPGAWRKIEGAFARVGRSQDAGRSWEYLESGLPMSRANIEALTLNTYPGGFALFAGTTDGDVFFSEDEGAHWSTIASTLPPVSKSGHYRGLRPDLVAAH
jgi:photosystem II stability/assembly factor-like uncharacterized protein